MYTFFEGESILIPATVTGDKDTITAISATIKASSSRANVPAMVQAGGVAMTVSDYTSGEIVDGYLFSLADSSDLTAGVYFINFEYTAGGFTNKGIPQKLVIKESVI